MATENDVIEINSDQEQQPILTNEDDDFISLPKSVRKNPGKEYVLDGITVKFPFEAYQSQLDMMTSIIKTLKNTKGHALLESPTGSGKSMAILCGALAWLESEKKNRKNLPPPPLVDPCGDLDISRELAEIMGESTPAKKAKFDCGSCQSGCDTGLDENGKLKIGEGGPAPIPKIYFASRTHKQIAQLVKELRRTGYNPNFTVLASRNQYCINENVRKSKDINEACKEHFAVCNYTGKLAKTIDRFMSQRSTPNMDIEDLMKFGKSNHVCPYYLAREVSDYADIIFAPYNYIMDPGIRASLGIKLDNAIVIIDEAHNIEDTCRSAGSYEINADNLYAVQTELNILLSGVGENAVDRPEAHRSLLHLSTILHSWMSTNCVSVNSLNFYEEKVDVWRDQQIITALNDLGVNPETVAQWQRHVDAITQASMKAPSSTGNNSKVKRKDAADEDRKILSMGSIRVFGSLLMVLKYIIINGGDTLQSYRMVRIQKVKSERGNRRLEVMLGFWCLSPEVVFKPIANEVKSIILTSGTLSPMNTFASELFTRFDERLEANHVISPEQVWIGCLPNSPQGMSFVGNFKTMETYLFQDELSRSIEKICNIVPYGVLVFLPSYAFMEKLLNRMKSIGIYDQISEIKKVFIEPKQGTTKDFELLMRRYYECIETCKSGAAGVAKTSTANRYFGARVNGALFFAVYRGKVSEGLDLADDNCRAVIPVGIPYPAFKDQKVILKREFNDKFSFSKKILNGHSWYETQAFRALNQALGRCIRHRLDWGAILLLEQRFSIPGNVNQLSKWVRNRVAQHPNFTAGMKSLEDFIKVNQAKEAELEQEILQIRNVMKEDDKISFEDDE